MTDTAIVHQPIVQITRGKHKGRYATVVARCLDNTVLVELENHTATDGPRRFYSIKSVRVVSALENILRWKSH